jgi:hypothetical protein
MPRNTIKGKSKKKGTTKATGRDYSKEKKFQSSAKQKKYRAELNREAKKRGIYGKRHKAGKDLSHTSNGKMVLEDTKKNKARNGKNGKSTLKSSAKRRTTTKKK